MNLRVLFIVTERLSANGICALTVAKSMVERGEEVCCIVNREYGDELSFEQDRIRFFTVRPRLVYTLVSMLAKRRDLSQIKRRIYSIICWVVNKAELIISLPTWPVISYSYSRRIYKRIKEVSVRTSFDVIVPIYTQIDTIIAANRYKRNNKKVVVIPYFLDSLAAGYGPKIMSKRWIENRGLKWEQKLLLDVNHIVMMKSSEPFYQKRQSSIRYFSKISFLDLPLFIPQYNKDKNDVHGLIEILYVGTIPGHIRNPKYFLDVFSKVVNSNLQLTIVGPSTCESLIHEYIIRDKRIKRIQSLPHSEAIERINKADILLNLGNNLTTMTPSKIFEYISTGKPIISTAPIAEEPCVPYLIKYGNACILYEDKTIEESVALLEDFISCASDIDPARLKEVFCLNQPQAFLQVIEHASKNI